jgi:hypothetical protein
VIVLGIRSYVLLPAPAKAVFLVPRSQSARGADKAITDASDQHVQTKHNSGDEDDGAADGLAPRANGPASCSRRRASETQVREGTSELAIRGEADDDMERVTGIEPALSAWE